ncbi:MAG: hypothetical protein HKN21_10100 [Candidatus Eisenbacteria bacterium]|uniref:Yip1 domain-containing protein n=1 Tax=Eiseniibacteriota bacterium TaxID=2212470 RepID=A0A7Y2H2K2_UNCEI|nr:hypothetical protein [Candidatus Eisenbacteria bacterium]
MTSDTPPPVQPPTVEPPVIPWERPGAPFGSSLIDTIKLFVTNPGEAFRQVPVNSELIKPILYAVIIGVVGSFAEWIYQTLFGGITNSLIPSPDTGSDMEGFAFAQGLGFLGVVLAIFIIPIALFIGSGIQHLVLMVVGGNNKGYMATFRAACYSSGTSSLASLVPICGSFVGLFWGIFLAIVGLAELQNISKGKAALAVLLPVLLICICAGIGFALFAGSMAAIMGAEG